jgi:hypothetical protein
MYMLTQREGVDPMEQLEQMESESPQEGLEGDARVRRLADALRAADPRYDANEIDWEGRKAVELLAEDGIQITLWPDHADFNFPYWDSLDAERITDDIEKAARIIAAETGWRLYDLSWRSGSIRHPTLVRSSACSTTGARSSRKSSSATTLPPRLANPSRSSSGFSAVREGDGLGRAAPSRTSASRQGRQCYLQAKAAAR